MASMLGDDVRVAVSSVLNRDTKQYGKKCMFDNDETTCWNSDQGEKQWIKVAFGKDMDLKTASKLQLRIQFQGGFSCKLCSVSLLDRTNQAIATCDCYPEDINSVQDFELHFLPDSNESSSFQFLHINFRNTTDFFGRITVYYLNIINKT